MEPGRYDDLANIVMWKTKGKLVALIVVGGDRGNGFSVCAVPELLIHLPGLLRHVATDIENGKAP